MATHSREAHTKIEFEQYKTKLIYPFDIIYVVVDPKYVFNYSKD